MTETVEALRAQLHELRQRWPELPRPFDPHSQAARRYQQEGQCLVRQVEDLEARITRLTCPIDLSERPGRQPLRALPPVPKRFRR